MAWSPGGKAAGGLVQGEEPDDRGLQEEPAQSCSSSRQQHGCGGGPQHQVSGCGHRITNEVGTSAPAPPVVNEEILLPPSQRLHFPTPRT